MLSGRFCSACGQPADVQIPTLGRVVVDALGDLLSFDSRLWRSLAVLAFKPGRLTNHYLEGRRARYTPPFRMYVITSLAFFVVFSLVRALTAADAPDGATDEATVADAVEDPLDAAVAPGEERLRIIIDNDDLDCQIQVAPEVGPEVREDLEAACRRVENEIGASFGREFADNFPILMLVFIPIVAAIMKALYLFARRKYVEHLLFFLHVHTFFFLVALPTIYGVLRRSHRCSRFRFWSSVEPPGSIFSSTCIARCARSTAKDTGSRPSNTWSWAGATSSRPCSR